MKMKSEFKSEMKIINVDMIKLKEIIYGHQQSTKKRFRVHDDCSIDGKSQFDRDIP